METKGQSEPFASPVSHETEDSADLVRKLHEAARAFPDVDRILRSLMRAKVDQDRKIADLKTENTRLNAAIEKIVVDNVRLVEANRQFMSRVNPQQDMLARGIQEAHAATLIVDPVRGNVVYANDAADKLFGPSVGMNAFALFLNGIRPYAQDPCIDESVVRELPEPYGTVLWKRLRETEDRVYERVRLKTVMRKGIVDAALVMKAINDTNGHPWFIVEALDIESLNKDAMTGLFRREVGISALVREIEHRDGKRVGAQAGPISVIMMDIDDFKSFNTRFGYEDGNTVLRKIAGCIRSEIRAKDVACRWFSGDEFLVVIYGGCVVATAVAERICRQVKELRIRLVDIPTRTQIVVSVSMSVGVAECEPNDDWASLTKRAESELRQAKHDGKGRVSTSRQRVIGG